MRWCRSIQPARSFGGRNIGDAPALLVAVTVGCGSPLSDWRTVGVRAPQVRTLRSGGRVHPLWMSTARRAVARIKTANNVSQAVIALTPSALGQVAVGDSALWAAESVRGLTRIVGFPSNRGGFLIAG